MSGDFRKSLYSQIRNDINILILGSLSTSNLGNVNFHRGNGWMLTKILLIRISEMDDKKFRCAANFARQNARNSGCGLRSSNCTLFERRPKFCWTRSYLESTRRCRCPSSPKSCPASSSCSARRNSLLANWYFSLLISSSFRSAFFSPSSSLTRSFSRESFSTRETLLESVSSLRTSFTEKSKEFAWKTKSGQSDIIDDGIFTRTDSLRKTPSHTSTGRHLSRRGLLANTIEDLAETFGQESYHYYDILFSEKIYDIPRFSIPTDLYLREF